MSRLSDRERASRLEGTVARERRLLTSAGASAPVVSVSALVVEGNSTENGVRAAVILVHGPENAAATRMPPPRLQKATATDIMTAHLTAATLDMELNWGILLWIAPTNQVRNGLWVSTHHQEVRRGRGSGGRVELLTFARRV